MRCQSLRKWSVNSAWLAMSARYSNTSSRGRAIVTLTRQRVHGGRAIAARRYAAARVMRTTPWPCSGPWTSSDVTGCSRRSGRHSSQRSSAALVVIEALADQRACGRSPRSAAPARRCGPRRPCAGARAPGSEGRGPRRAPWRDGSPRTGTSLHVGQNVTSPGGPFDLEVHSTSEARARAVPPSGSRRIPVRSRSMESIESGTLAGIGSFRCDSMRLRRQPANERRACPAAPAVAATEFVRASLFGSVRLQGAPVVRGRGRGTLGWIEDVRGGLDEPGEYLAYERAGEVARVRPAQPVDADRAQPGRRRALRRPHRLPPARADRPRADGVRVLDDRSLNGVFVNGERVEWSTLQDGDEILVGLPQPALPRGRRARARRPASGADRPATARRPEPWPPTLANRGQHGGDDRSPLAEGRHRQDDGGPDADGHLPATRPRDARGGPRPAGQPVRLLRRPARRRAHDRRRAHRAAPQASEAITGDVIPANLQLAEAELALSGQDGARADAQARPARPRPRVRRRDPARLPALAGAAHRQRAGGRRPRAPHRRGPVLRHAGSRAGARGDRAGARQPQPGPVSGWGWCSTSPTCARSTRARPYQSLAEAFGDKVFETTIRQSIAYAESAERAVSILDYRPDLGADYIALADELLARLDLPEARQRLGALELAER